jgi:hypothetical protein
MRLDKTRPVTGQAAVPLSSSAKSNDPADYLSVMQRDSSTPLRSAGNDMLALTGGLFIISASENSRD